MKLRSIILNTALGMLATATALYGQHTTVSLDEAIKVTLRENDQMKNSLLNIEASEYQVKQAKGALLPKVDINGQYLYYMDVPSQYAPASAFGGPQGEYTKLTLNLPQTTSASIQSSQILFNQAAIAGLRAAKVANQSSQLQAEATREELVYGVSATYYTIQVLQDNLERLRDNIANLEKTVQINASLKDNELVSANTHNRLLINLENLRNQYENQLLAYQSNLTQLKQFMHMPLEDSIVVDAFAYDSAFEQYDASSIERRNDIRLQEFQIKMAEQEKKIAAASFYPTLTATMSMGYAGYYDEFAPGKQLNNDWISNRYVGMSLKIPVFDGFQRNFNVKQKQVAVRRHINTLSMMKSMADKELEDARTSYYSSLTQVESSKHSLALAEQLFASAQTEFENGLTSTTDLLNAQNDLSSARSNYTTALLNLKLAALGWKKASGTLLSEN